MRTAATIIVTVPLALSAAACGGSTGSHVAQLGSTTARSTSSSSSSSAAAPETGSVSFARCMRSHGIPNWPDPNTSGVFDKSEVTLERLGVSAARLQAAQSACRHLLPHGGVPTQAELQQARTQAVSFSRCIRRHGVPTFPDPGTGGRIPDPATVGIAQGSPTFQAANNACRRYRPPYIPSNGAYSAWARTHG